MTKLIIKEEIITKHSNQLGDLYYWPLRVIEVAKSAVVNDNRGLVIRAEMMCLVRACFGLAGDEIIWIKKNERVLVMNKVL